MARWRFEPGHTAAEFCVRHMMVTYVRGHFKNIAGALEFAAEARIDRHGFGVSWNSDMRDGGEVVGAEVLITIDAEAIREAG
jgi:polyisoprenoid-binding protein YceI